MEFDDEITIHLFRIELLNQVTCSLHRSTCCKEVIMEQNNVVLVDSILMNFYRIYAILLLVTLLIVSQGSFPGLRQSTIPAPNRVAMADDMTKPRLSIPTILVTPLSLYKSTISSVISLRASGDLNRVVTSRKLTPLIGQSGIHLRLSNNSFCSFSDCYIVLFYAIVSRETRPFSILSEASLVHIFVLLRPEALSSPSRQGAH